MTEQKNGKFEMPALPYAAADLAPALSAETIEFHYGKHLQTYLNNLNAALPGSAFEGKSLEDIVKTAEGGVFNNAGQFLNHSMYFLQFAAPKANNAPRARLPKPSPAISAPSKNSRKNSRRRAQASSVPAGSGSLPMRAASS